MKKAFGTVGAALVIIGTAGMMYSGADVSTVSGIVGLAASAFAAIAAIIGGFVAAK